MYAPSKGYEIAQLSPVVFQCLAGGDGTENAPRIAEPT